MRLSKCLVNHQKTLNRITGGTRAHPGEAKQAQIPGLPLTCFVHVDELLNLSEPHVCPRYQMGDHPPQSLKSHRTPRTPYSKYLNASGPEVTH